jgi:hypothetical protein
MSYGKELRSILLFCIITALSFLSANCSEKKKTPASGKKIYDFLANAESAKITTPQPELVKFAQQEFTIKNDKRAILFEHPISEVLFSSVPIPANAVLQFGVGINPPAWDKPGDGVTFEVTVVDEKSDKTLIFSEYIDPKRNSRDRKWFDYNLDLRAFAGQRVGFIFRTSAGPRNDSSYDWAGWSNPQIRLEAKRE